MRLKDKVAVVTGSGSGIGRQIAIQMAKEGAKLVLINRTESKAVATLEEIQANGGQGLVVPADVSKMDEMKNAMDKAMEKYGKIDIMCNIAGVYDGQSGILETTEETWDKVISVDLKGVFIGSKLAVEKMQENGGGVIINMSSVAGIRGNFGSTAYTAAKHGVIGLTGDVAAKFGKDNIRAVAICPGFVRTPLTGYSKDDTTKAADEVLAGIPLGRGGMPEDIANLAVFLVSEEASYITGSFFVIDGGLSI